MFSVVINTLDAQEAAAQGRFFGFRSVQLVGDGLKVDLPFIGNTIDAQGQSLRLFAEAMEQGEGELVTTVTNCLDIDLASLPGMEGRSFASLGDRVVTTLFEQADWLSYDEVLVYTASEGGT